MAEEIDPITSQEYQELLEDTKDDGDTSRDVQDAQLDQLESSAYQMGTKSADQYKWFWQVVKLRHPFHLVRAGNLEKPEIGNSVVSIRDAMNLAKLGRIFHHEKFAQYWEDTAGITAATSMAKKGWFMELSISQRKVRERGSPNPNVQQKKKSGLFSKPSGVENGE